MSSSCCYRCEKKWKVIFLRKKHRAKRNQQIIYKILLDTKAMIAKIQINYILFIAMPKNSINKKKKKNSGIP